jgi:hypothetical protein
VIIENKLDDSGRDVVWQALKYAGYCANLRQESVVEIFQLYLDQYEPNENRQAAEVIAEFMGWESLKEGVLNQRHPAGHHGCGQFPQRGHQYRAVADAVWYPRAVL